MREGSATHLPALALRSDASPEEIGAMRARRSRLAAEAAAVEAAGPDLKWFVIDMIPVTMIDATGLYAAEEVVSTLAARGIVFATAGRLTERTQWAKELDRERQSLLQQLEQTQAALARLERQFWTRLGRKLGFMK